MIRVEKLAEDRFMLENFALEAWFGARHLSGSELTPNIIRAMVTLTLHGIGNSLPGTGVKCSEAVFELDDSCLRVGGENSLEISNGLL